MKHKNIMENNNGTYELHPNQMEIYNDQFLRNSQPTNSDMKQNLNWEKDNHN